MKSMWRGAISFGLVNIAVRLYAATEEHDYRFHQVHRADAGRVRYRRVCAECGQQVEYEDIAKGYELADGRVVVLDREEFQQLPVRTDRSIDLLQFVPAGQVDPMLFQRSYYVEPEKQAVRPYVLLRQALESTQRAAVVKITLRQRETLGLVRARADVLVLHTMIWPDEVRAAEFDVLQPEPEVRSQELDMATSLVENLAADFTPEDFVDDYRQALGELIEAKSQGAPAPEASEPEQGGEVIDLMTALQRSVDQTGGATNTAAAEASGSGGAAKSGKQAKSSTGKAASSQSRATGAGSSSASSSASSKSGKSAKSTDSSSSSKSAKTASPRRKGGSRRSA